MFHPGQKVVFIGYDFPDPYGRDVLTKIGHVYTVNSTWLFRNQQAISLVEIDNGGCGWMASGFRPVVDKKNKTDISVFRKLLKTQKILEPV